MERSFLKWENLKHYFISDSQEDFILAGNALEQKETEPGKNASINLA
jgi:hypothetical protein